MKKGNFLLYIFILIGLACDVNQVEFDNLKEPTISGLVAIPIGEISYTVRDLFDELKDTSLVLEEDPETTFLSLVYTDTFSYSSSNDLIDIGDISKDVTQSFKCE